MRRVWEGLVWVDGMTPDCADFETCMKCGFEAPDDKHTTDTGEAAFTAL